MFVVSFLFNICCGFFFYIFVLLHIYLVSEMKFWIKTDVIYKQKRKVNHDDDDDDDDFNGNCVTNETTQICVYFFWCDRVEFPFFIELLIFSLFLFFFIFSFLKAMPGIFFSPTIILPNLFCLFIYFIF